MSRVRIFPYNPGSRSAKTLAARLEVPRLRTVGSRFRPRANDVVINWGSSRCPSFSPARVLNKAQSIISAANKLTTFQRFKEEGVRAPEFWTRHADLPADVKLVSRSVLNGHSGEGITIGMAGDLPTNVLLYTRYLRKLSEYRVHVVGSKPIFSQRKARKLDVAEPNWEVRNLANGFVFVEHASPAESLCNLAVQAVAALGLDFGAVDVVHCKDDDQYYVLEVNTACGLEERTADKYAAAFKDMLNGEAV